MIRLTGLVLASIFAVTPALAEDPCPTRDLVTEFLSTEYEETPIAMGVANNGGVVEVFSSVDRRTWTIMITMPDGNSCMIAAGQTWESLPLIAPAGIDPEA